MGKFAGGMPFQVLPPPPPPKQQPSKPTQNGSGVPPPPRPPPQNFEPPPMGMRPEIKIPPNPMANLRPAPKPQINDNFWLEEYLKEKTGSAGNEAAQNYQSPVQQREPEIETSRPFHTVSSPAPSTPAVVTTSAQSPRIQSQPQQYQPDIRAQPQQYQPDIRRAASPQPQQYQQDIRRAVSPQLVQSPQPAPPKRVSLILT